MNNTEYSDRNIHKDYQKLSDMTVSCQMIKKLELELINHQKFVKKLVLTKVH